MYGCNGVEAEVERWKKKKLPLSQLIIQKCMSYKKVTCEINFFFLDKVLLKRKMI